MDLTTHVGDIEFRTPLILASGYITETPELFLSARELGCSAMVTRSLREKVPEERCNTPAPRYHVFDQESMLNCEWSNENDWAWWLDKWASTVMSTGDPLIISVSARDIEGCKRVVNAFTETSLASAFEVNVSCAHSGVLHGNLNTNIDHLKSVVSEIRRSTRLPVWVKLSYSQIMREMAMAAEAEGANAIVCTNTIGPGLAIDTNTTKLKLGIHGGAGGVSGPAIFPIALWCVYQIAQSVEIPIVGSGGINSSDKALQMLMAGAHAVQMYTAPALKGPHVFGPILHGMTEFLQSHDEFNGLQELVGCSQEWASDQTRFEAKVPITTPKYCTNCRQCERACAFQAISFHKCLTIDSAHCVGCNACVGVCPSGAITAQF